MSFIEIMINLSRIAAVVQAWELRINRMNLGGLPKKVLIDRILRFLERMATDPELDQIIEDKF